MILTVYKYYINIFSISGEMVVIPYLSGRSTILIVWRT